MTEKPEDIMLTKDALALRLECSVRTISRMRSEGKLPAPVLVGERFRWYWPEVVEFLLDNRPASAIIS